MAEGYRNRPDLQALPYINPLRKDAHATINLREEPGSANWMRESLFEPVRQWQGPVTADETTFAFLERGGRREAIGIRRWMEEWFPAFPAAHRDQLKRMLRSEDFSAFMGAYFELQVFAMLQRLGCRVEVHPRVSGTTGTVDFRVWHGQDSFYVEATVCGIGQGILCSNANEEDAVHKIRDALREPHSDVWLHATGELRTTLGKEQLARPIEHLLARYGPENVKRVRAEPRWRRPQTSIRENGWRLDVELRPPIASDGRGRIYGPSRTGAVDGSSPLTIALSKKAYDWGKKRLEQEAFLIAVNVCHSEFSWYDGDAMDIMRALYCELREGYSREFRGGLRRVTGVIAVNNAVLGNETSAAVRIFRNGDAGIPRCLEFLLEERTLGELVGMSP